MSLSKLTIAQLKQQAAARLASFVEQVEPSSQASSQEPELDLSYIATEADLAYDKQLFTAFWKWALLHPDFSIHQLDKVITVMSGRPVLATFVRADPVRFLALLAPASISQLFAFTNLLANMDLCVPADIQDELYEFLLQANQHKEK